MLAVSMSPPVASYPAIQKRPKLSLKTSELPITYGITSRGLPTIATPTATVTPTTLNTFNNTFDLTHRPSPTSIASCSSLVRSATGPGRLSRSQSPRPKQVEVPYQVNLPFGIKPILKNTPFPRVRANPISSSNSSSSNSSSAKRVFFPAPKHVSFANVIEEEIFTKVHTARHSDLLDHDEESENENLDRCSSTQTSFSVERRGTGSRMYVLTSVDQKRDNPSSPPSLRSISVSSAEIGTESVATPSNTRKRRRWEWTLEPLHASQAHSVVGSVTDLDIDDGKEAESALMTAEETRRGSATSDSDSGTESHFSANSSDSESDSNSEDDGIGFQTYQHHLADQQRDVTPKDQLAEPAPVSRSASLSPPTLLSTTISTSLLLSPPLESPGPTDTLGNQSPRKRKADCLDMASSALVLSGQESSLSDPEDESANVGSSSGRTSSKRRDRAATL